MKNERIIIIGIIMILMSSISLFAQNNQKDSTTQRILIAYATESGSTKEIADSIGKILSEHNQVTVLSISEVTDLSTYTQVIIGAPILYDKWKTDARDFVKDNEEVLAKKNVSFFLTCLVLCGYNEKVENKAEEYALNIKNEVPQINVKHFGKFAGVLNYKKIPFKSRMMLKTYLFINGNKLKEGDYRDWKQIKEWTKNISL